MKNYRNILKTAISGLIMGVMFVVLGVCASAETLEWDGKTGKVIR